MDQQWKLEKEIVRQVESIIFLLAASKSWIVEGDKILFDKNDDLARFNSYLEKIQQIAQQQEQMQKKSFTDANQKMEAMKTSLGK